MEKIISAFETSLLDPTLSSACIDIAELGIDSILDEGIFKGIPIVSLLIGIGKTAQNIHDRNLLRQTLQFINTFNENAEMPDKYLKYKRRLLENPKLAEKELGRVLILLNSNIDLQKSKLLARFFRAYIEEKIDWEKFCELSEICSHMFVTDIELLFSVYNKEITDTNQCLPYKADRLIGLGLLNSTMKSMVVISDSSGITYKYIQTNALGNLFCKLGISEKDAI